MAIYLKPMGIYEDYSAKFITVTQVLPYSRGCKARAFIVCVPSKWMASHSVDTVPTKWEIL